MIIPWLWLFVAVVIGDGSCYRLICRGCWRWLLVVVGCRCYWFPGIDYWGLIPWQRSLVVLSDLCLPFLGCGCLCSVVAIVTCSLLVVDDNGCWWLFVFGGRQWLLAAACV